MLSCSEVGRLIERWSWAQSLGGFNEWGLEVCSQNASQAWVFRTSSSLSYLHTAGRRLVSPMRWVREHGLSESSCLHLIPWCLGSAFCCLLWCWSLLGLHLLSHFMWALLADCLINLFLSCTSECAFSWFNFSFEGLFVFPLIFHSWGGGWQCKNILGIRKEEPRERLAGGPHGRCEPSKSVSEFLQDGS